MEIKRDLSMTAFAFKGLAFSVLTLSKNFKK